MDRTLWEKIAGEYEQAKKCLWCPKDALNWHRDEEQGYYYLWCAYHDAAVSDGKDPLLYARILAMMSRENRQITEYRRFHSLVAPAKNAYEEAVSAGQPVPEKELEEIRREYERLRYVLKKTDDGPEELSEAYSRIEGLEKVEDFCFHDSRPVCFEHQKDRALLKLEYDGICVTFEFTEIKEIQVDTDPVCEWVQKFYCYLLFDIPKHLYFDVGSYRITCEHIRVVEVAREEQGENR